VKLFAGKLFSGLQFAGKLFRGILSTQPVEPPKSGGIPAYYLFDSEQEAKDKLKQYPKKKTKKLAKKPELATDYPSLSSKLDKPVVAPVRDLVLQKFISEQEIRAAQAIDDELEEEEIGAILAMI
jgi:hypothetical protein